MKSRSTTSLIILLMLLAFFIPNTAGAAYLQGGGEVTRERDEDEIYIPPTPYIPPKRYFPPVYNNFYSFVDSLSLFPSSPIRYKGLNIYLLRGNGYHIQSSNIITLDEAYQRGVIRINEYGGGTVSKIRISSYAGSYIFLMAGEIVAGGRQTRTIVKDVLIAPYSKNIVVDVYCIEEGRWDDGSGRVFIPVEPMLDSSIRGKVMAKRGQDKIWNGIRSRERESGYSSKTHNLLEIYRKKGADRGLENELNRIVKRLPYDSIGMVAVKKDRILGIEAFYSQDMFLKQFKKLFRSYYYTEVPGWFYSGVTGRDVRKFLSKLSGSSLSEDRGYPGAGRLYDVSVNGFYGNALDFGGILHLSLID